jgi:hypothetical protein
MWGQWAPHYRGTDYRTCASAPPVSSFWARPPNVIRYYCDRFFFCFFFEPPGCPPFALDALDASAPFPPVSSRGARRCRELVSLPISTTEETHETLDIGLDLWPLSNLCIMRGCTCSLYRDVRPLRDKTGICPHNPN